MSFEILPPTDDWIFKLLFGDERNKSMLIDMLTSFIELPQEEYELTFLDTYLKKEFEEDKYGIVDIKVKTKSGKILHIEIQINPVADIGERLSFYKSKLIVEQIGEGQRYNVIQKVICICILSYELFPDVPDYINDFRYYNIKNQLLFKAIPEEIYTLELSKLPVASDGSELYDWLQFLKSNTKEDLEMVAERNPEIRKAVNTLYELSADARVRAEYEARQKALRDRASQLGSAFDEGHEKGRMEVAQRLKDMGLSAEQILAATGIKQEKIP